MWESKWQTKVFYFNAFVYLLAIIGTTLYAYGRLDSVRSYKTERVR